MDQSSLLKCRFMKIRAIYLSALLLGFLDAFFIYVLSTYFSSITESDKVGIFYLISYSGVFLCLYFLPPLIRHIGKTRALQLSLGISLVASIYLSIMQDDWFSLIAVFCLIVATNVAWVALDIALESHTPDKHTGKIRGTYLTLMNMGFLIAPFLSTTTLERFNYQGIFTVLAITYLIVLLLTFLFVSDLKDVFTSEQKITNTEFKRIYWISFAMEMFYALMIVYAPLYLRSLDFSWTEIGIIFTIMLLPFVVLQYPLGFLADKYLKEKELIIGSLLIVSISTLCLPFLSHDLIIWGIFLFATRVGIAGIAVLRDTYFFRRVDGNDIDLIAKFRRARPLANILGMVIASVVLIFFPLSSIFFVVGGVLLLALYTAIKLNKNSVGKDQIQTKKERNIIGNLVGSFIIASILSFFFLILTIPFLKLANNLPEQEKASIGEFNLWRVVLVYGVLALITSLYYLVKKTKRGIILFLFIFWALGTSLVISITNVQKTDNSPQNEPLQAKISLPVPEGEKLASFNWKYKGKEYSLNENLYESYHQFYKALPVYVSSSAGSEIEQLTMRNELFLSGVDGDSTLSILAQKLRAIGEEKKLNENQLVEFVSSFVQTIPYDQDKLDRRTSGLSGATEKTTYPYEVLYENTGVCQDKSYLVYELLKELGYGVAIFLFPNPEDNHMAIGVKCPFEYSNYESGYCFIETTSLGNKIGMIPDLIPKSRIATSDVEISATESGAEDTQYHTLGNVEILNKIDGKEYTGIKDTIATQRAIASLRRTLDQQSKELKSLDADLKDYNNEIDSMEKKLKKLAKADDYDEYKDLYSKYDKTFSKYKKAYKIFQEKLKINKDTVSRHNALVKEFYR